MAGISGGMGELALWLHLRRGNAQPVTEVPSAPAGAGALLVLHLPPDHDDPAALDPIMTALRSLQPNLRLLITGGRPGDSIHRLTARTAAITDPAEAEGLISALDPAGLLILGDDLPAALISAFSQAGRPVILAEARLQDRARRGIWQDTLRRSLLARVDHMLLPDLRSASLARNLAGRSSLIEISGPVTAIRPPLGSSEAERLAMAQVLGGRHVWLAAAPSAPELPALLAAHRALLHYNHRAMLIIAAPPPGSAEGLVESAAGLGMAGILRSDDADPTMDDHILIAEDDDEMGLWYRLAPASFMGGTLIEGEGQALRHPFEPAALGSAIMHGPISSPYAAVWAQLDGAGAARRVTDAEGLTRAVADLSGADQAAILAQNAWSISTGGAAVVRHIATTVTAAMRGRK